MVQVDLAHGASQKVIAFLEAPLRRAIGWETRGEYTCYGLIVAEDGRTLYITLNGFRTCDLGFYHATPIFLALHIPPQEIAQGAPTSAPVTRPTTAPSARNPAH